jgi:hypothetical protein
MMIEVDRLKEALELLDKFEQLQPKAIERLRAEGVVFTKSPLSNPEITEAEKWEDIAFWLYTDLCEINRDVRQLKERLEEEKEESSPYGISWDQLQKYKAGDIIDTPNGQIKIVGVHEGKEPEASILEYQVIGVD